ncbi:hypothetical protein NMY22_g11119 [Coprinellus aureogranulatus]|nr:hypothetical protein NMY22_g11119 [Coprinellus aureogranulatus]
MILLPVVIASLVHAAVAVPAPHLKVDSPAGFNITSYSATGSGCPSGSTYHIFDSDIPEAAVVFSDFNAEIGPGVPTSANTKECRLTFGLSIPEGYRFGVSSVDYHSSYALEDSVSVTHSSAYSFEGDSNQASSKLTLDGPLSIDLYISHGRFTPGNVFSSCGAESAILNVDTRVALESSFGKGQGRVASESLNSSGYLITIVNVEHSLSNREIPLPSEQLNAHQPRTSELPTRTMTMIPHSVARYTEVNYQVNYDASQDDYERKPFQQRISLFADLLRKESWYTSWAWAELVPHKSLSLPLRVAIMSLSQEEIAALADSVSSWTVQEYIYVSFYTSYLYYVLTSIGEEAEILPLQRVRGKVLWMVIRWGTCARIAVDLSYTYRTYSTMSAEAMLILGDVLFRVARLGSQIALGIFLCAILRAKLVLFIVVMLLATGMTIVGMVFAVVSDIAFPATPATPFDKELGYSCYFPSDEEWAEATFIEVGRDIRGYVLFATTSFAALITRYREYNGRLFKVLRRDGGIYYITLSAWTFVVALLNTPSIGKVENLTTNPLYVFVNQATYFLTPILAQRLMINMRRIDCLGSQPLASNLIFAQSKDEFEMETFDESDHTSDKMVEETKDPGAEVRV